MHLLAAITHGTGLVISQDKVARAGKANEVTHFKPLLEPRPCRTWSSPPTQCRPPGRTPAGPWRTSTRSTCSPLGNQPGLYAALDVLPWETTPVAAATSEVNRGRIETRTPDLRGHGDSAKPHDLAAYPPDVLALVEHLELGTGDYDLGGYSLGAGLRP